MGTGVMKSRNYNIKSHLKNIYIVRLAYYKFNYFIYSAGCLIFNRTGLTPNLAFIRKALCYGVNPNQLKDKLRKIIKNNDWNKNDIYLLVAILNALGYVNNGIKLLRKKSKLDNHISTRVFKADVFSAFGHGALLDIFIKAKLLGLQKYSKDYILGKVPNIAKIIAGDYFNIIDKLTFCSETFVENFNYTYLSDKFILLDEFNTQIQIKYESKYGNTLENKIFNNIFSSVKDSIFDKSHLNWYVCIHVRNSDDCLTDLRNSKIISYYKSIKLILNRGGSVYRIMEDGLVNEFIYDHGEIIEIPHAKSINTQLRMIANCRFFIGTGSGPINMASHVLGRPVLATNWAPLGCRLSWRNQVILPKQYKQNGSEYSMPYSRRLNGCFSRIESRLRLDNLGFSCFDNDENEIESATIEMINATKDIVFNGEYFLKSQLQQKFHKLITNHGKLMPIYISYEFSEQHNSEI